MFNVVLCTHSGCTESWVHVPHLEKCHDIVQPWLFGSSCLPWDASRRRATAIRACAIIGRFTQDNRIRPNSRMFRHASSWWWRFSLKWRHNSHNEIWNKDTNAFLITFGLATLSQYIKLAYLHNIIRVEVHIPNPMRCFLCQRFGHHRNNYMRKLTYARCGTEGHDDTSCETSPSCINCGEAHNAYSKDCLRWKKEKEIQRIKCLRNVSFPEARKIVDASNHPPTAGQSYAKVDAPIAVGKTTCSAATQTNLTWVSGGIPSKVLGPQTSEVQTDELIPIPVTMPNNTKDQPTTSQNRPNSTKNTVINRINNKDVKKKTG